MLLLSGRDDFGLVFDFGRGVDSDREFDFDFFFNLSFGFQTGRGVPAIKFKFELSIGIIGFLGSRRYILSVVVRVEA